MPTDPRAVDPARKREGWPTSAFTLASALGALVFASRLWLAQVWGSAVPFMDAWEAEAIGLYRPWLDGSWSFFALFRAHNEHRVFLTRATDLLLFFAYGRWEPWAQLVVNAALHAATAIALYAVLRLALSRRGAIALAVGIAVIFTSTCGWQNALWGFQSQFYFSNLLSVLAIAALLLARPFSLSWWGGWGAAVLALFSLGSGVFASVAALVVLLALPANDPRGRRPWLAGAVVAAVPLAAILLSTNPPGQLPLHARNFAEYYAVVARCLSWPEVNSPVAWVLLQAPAVALLLCHLARRRSLEAVDRVALAFVALAALQALAVARSRGAGLLDHRPLSRYQDPLLLGVAAQWFCALRLTALGRKGRLLAIGWSGVVAVGLLTLTTFNLSVNLPYKRDQDAANLTQIRSYLADHDGSVFTRDPRFPGPHPNPAVVKKVLDDPVLRPVLPRIFYETPLESAPGMKPWFIAMGFPAFLVSFVLFATVVSVLWRADRR